MAKQFLYGGKLAVVKPAAGVPGIILRSVQGGLTFRVYHDADGFTDYEIRHDELSVTIAADELASFYEIGDDRILDHSPQLLGLRRAEG